MNLRKYGVFILAFFITIIVSAQRDFKPGYIINVNGDTLVGLVDNKPNVHMFISCDFRIDEDSEIKRYLPSDMKGYAIYNGPNYVSRKVEHKTIICKILVSGKLILYANYSRASGSTYYLENEKYGFRELFYRESDYTGETAMKVYRSVQHIGILKIYTSDKPEFVERIERMQELNEGLLIKIVSDYNNSVMLDSLVPLADSSNISNAKTYNHVYRYRGLDKKVAMELLGGVNYSEKYETYAPSFGVIAHIGVSKVTDRVY